MTAVEVYNAVICRGGHIIPRGAAVIVKAPASVDLADLKAELREHKAELAVVARSERAAFAEQWRRDVADKKAGREPCTKQWEPADFAVWARTMIGIWQAEEMAEIGVDAEVHWLREMAGNLTLEMVA